jgi:hypothetical protein
MGVVNPGRDDDSSMRLFCAGAFQLYVESAQDDWFIGMKAR